MQKTHARKHVKKCIRFHLCFEQICNETCISNYFMSVFADLSVLVILYNGTYGQKNHLYFDMTIYYYIIMIEKPQIYTSCHCTNKLSLITIFLIDAIHRLITIFCYILKLLFQIGIKHDDSKRNVK